MYKRRQKSLDCFHVAFSGGKDSIVLLDLVKKALPRSSFMVVFGDTKMEFPDTYELVDKVEAQCKEEGINFYRAASHFEPDESWKLFGPPSRVLRWCCTVHKAAPQTLKIREILEKNDYVGMDFVGVRAHESATRATYEEENFGKKQRVNIHIIQFWNGLLPRFGYTFLYMIYPSTTHTKKEIQELVVCSVQWAEGNVISSSIVLMRKKSINISK